MAQPRTQDSLDGFMAQPDFTAMREQAQYHTPPVISNLGFERKVHKAVANRHIDKLHDVNMPQQWMQPTRFSTRTAMNAARHAEMRPHNSFDVDGDGFVSQEDWAISRRHDLGHSGILTGGQRDSAIAETCYRMGTKLHDDEIGTNARARRILRSLREEPEFEDTARREGRLRSAGMAVASLKMKSSHQLKECLALPARKHEPEADGPVYTRTMLLERRKIENAALEESGRHNFLLQTGQIAY